MNYAERRQAERLDTKQKVDCRNAQGLLPEVWLVDLGVTGCQVIIRSGHLAVGQQVVIRPNGLEGLPAVVRWVAGDRAGIEFARELHPSVLDYLLQSEITSQGGRTYSNLGMIDQFGRLMPDLPTLRLFRSAA